MRPLGFGMSQLPVLHALADGGSRTQKELAQWARVEQPTMAEMLARMERDGLIVRLPDPADRRSALISLTPLGRKSAKEALAAAMQTNELGLSVFSSTERAQFLDMLRRLIAVLDADQG